MFAYNTYQKCRACVVSHENALTRWTTMTTTTMTTTRVRAYINASAQAMQFIWAHLHGPTPANTITSANQTPFFLPYTYILYSGIAHTQTLWQTLSPFRYLYDDTRVPVKKATSLHSVGNSRAHFARLRTMARRRCRCCRKVCGPRSQSLVKTYRVVWVCVSVYVSFSRQGSEAYEVSRIYGGRSG